MWSWQSPNSSLVVTVPARGTATIAPSSTFQPAGLSPWPRHFKRSRPSNSTTASEGAWPGTSCVLAVPGVTLKLVEVAEKTEENAPFYASSQS